MSSGTKKMSAFILRAIEMASLATQKRGIKCRSTTPGSIVRTILPAILVITGIRNVDHKRWIDDAGAEGLKKVKKAFKREDGPIIITQPDGPAYVHSEPATDALDLFEDFD